ncbi:MAG: AAA family ATPase [Gammaproteobacteria bacterium]
MISLPGYKIKEQLYEGENSILLRAIREKDGLPVIIKLLKKEYPSPDEIVRFKREFQITQDIQREDIIKVYDFEKNQNSYAIVLEDFGGLSLAEQLKMRRLGLKIFLQMAVRIVDIIEYIHSHTVIHKDINPSNIIWNPSTDTVKLIDFGISTTIPRESPEISNPNLLEGTLAYISPEQTGRMNRGIDYRTDFYSLGVSFYQMLVGNLPFESNDVMELVHAHIAKVPTSPHHVMQEIPEAVSNIIMKLMAKNAEDRYQSGHGLRSDLQNCLTQLELTGKIEPFPLGQHDMPERFQIPEKLYGREEEVKTLLNAFDTVMEAPSKLLLVAGYSGIGKSSIIHEVQKPIVEKRGFFITGKFDQYQQNIPYAAFIQAFDQLVRQLLTEGQTVIEQWKKILLSVLGPNAGVITELIPSVEWILGPQDKPSQLGPTETSNRFNLVLFNFIQAIATPSHPLVVFLDDLQWADPSSLQVLHILLVHPEMHNLLVIGAYRDNEVDQAHILNLALEDLKKARVQFETIKVPPLPKNEVIHLIADTLLTSPEDVQTLADLCYEKTQGNPFFLNQLLLSLYKNKLIKLNDTHERWIWDIDQVKKIGVTDNVVDLMVEKIKNLNENTQNVLQIAACIGHRFNLKILASVLNKSITDTAADLWEALQEGLILPEDESYKFVLQNEESTVGQSSGGVVYYRFLHDRVQQATYSLISGEHKEEIHFKIGTLLLETTPQNKVKEFIFDIVNQLNAGSRFITEKNKIWQLIRLNYQAGERAKDSTALKAAMNYLKIAHDLLPSSCWQEQYELSFNILFIYVQTLFGNAEYDEAEKVIRELLKNVKNPIDESKIRFMQVTQYTFTRKMEEATNCGLLGLRSLGIKLKNNPSTLSVIIQILIVKWKLRNLSIPSLVERPLITDEKIKATLLLLNELRANAIFQNKQNLFVITCIKSFLLALKHGISAETASSYAGFALLLSHALGDLKNSTALAKTAELINSKLNDMKFKSQVIFFGCISTFPEQNAWQTMLESLKRTIETGLQTGSLMWVALACHYGPNFDAETPQQYVINELKKYLSICQTSNSAHALDGANISLGYRMNLVGETASRTSLSYEGFDENECINRLEEDKFYSAFTAFYIRKVVVCYTYDAYEEAYVWYLKAKKTIMTLGGVPYLSECSFYILLTLAANYSTLKGIKKFQAWWNIKRELMKMRKWAKGCPSFFLCKLLIMEAENARLFKPKANVGALYDKAIDVAKKDSFLNIEALGNELAAKYYLNQGQKSVAQLYMSRARYAYISWGATAKVQFLDEKYGDIILIEAQKRTATIQTTTGTRTDSRVSTVSQTLDLNSVIKASQTISGEIVLSDLLTKMMSIVLENAGAENGWLILEKNGKWFIEAESSVSESKVQTKVLESKPIDSLPDSLINSVIYSKTPIVLENPEAQGDYTQDLYIKRVKPKSVLCTPLLNQGKLSGLLYLENNLTPYAFTADRLEILNLLSVQIGVSVDNARLYSRTTSLNKSLSNLNKAYERFVPQEFLRLLGKKSITDVKVGDQIQKDMTVMFTDIRNFTTISESMTPEENFTFINQFVNLMEPVIAKHGGFVDKYLGDGIMALFPTADSAVDAAVEMQLVLKQYNIERLQSKMSVIRAGIGLNSGILMLGTVGGEHRMDGTVISDAVNLASRVQELTKIYKVLSLITEETFMRLKDPNKYAIRKMDNELIRGKQKLITIYELYDADPTSVKQLKSETVSEFEQGIEFYNEKRFDEAFPIFDKILSKNKEDYPAEIYRQRCLEFSSKQSSIKT